MAVKNLKKFGNQLFFGEAIWAVAQHQLSSYGGKVYILETTTDKDGIPHAWIKHSIHGRVEVPNTVPNDEGVLHACAFEGTTTHDAKVYSGIFVGQFDVKHYNFTSYLGSTPRIRYIRYADFCGTFTGTITEVTKVQSNQ